MDNESPRYQKIKEANKRYIWIRWLEIILFGLGGSLVVLDIEPGQSVDFSLLRIVAILSVFAATMNIFFGRLRKRAEKRKDKGLFNVLGFAQIIFEISIFSMIFYCFGALESLLFLLFTLPIVAGCYLVEMHYASLFISLASIISLNLIVYLEKVEIIIPVSLYNIPNSLYIYSSTTNLGFISFIFLLIGLFSSCGAKFVFNVGEGKNEAQMLDQAEKNLTAVNEELEKKIKESEQAELAMLKAFSDLKQERKRSESERDKTAAIISNFVDPIIVIDLDNKLTLFNPAARNIFALDDNDLGKEVSPENNYSMENFKEVASREYEVIKKKSEMEDNPMDEEVVINYAEQELTYKVITAAVIDNNKNLGVMKIFYNLTREKMIDKLKSEFISIAAHQLRTPLAAIKWAIKMVLDGDEGEINESQKAMLSKGYVSNERIINLVNDMLNVSRIEEGRFGYAFAEADIIELISSTVDNLEGKLKEKSINVAVKKPENIFLIAIDKQKMELVFENILENAVKYTPVYGKIEVEIRPNKELVEISIKDNGVGIPAEDQPKLFSKFFRAANVVRLQTEGSGLGMFIAKNIVIEHGGKIICKSEEGVGTEFIITLPIKHRESHETETHQNKV
ncbi:MAG: ATP-binding protein [bacterium]